MKVKTYDYGEVEIEIRDVINKQYLGKPHRNVIIFDGHYLLNPKDNGGDLIVYDSIGQKSGSEEVYWKAGQIYDSLMDKLEIISEIDDYLEDIVIMPNNQVRPLLNGYDSMSQAYESGELDQLLLDRGVKIINDDGYGNFELALIGDSVIELDTYTRYLLTGFHF
tara:strand:+ start:521 stop:1015 length:495 start_codon:yes stop_codon:yes gene_type:complete